MEFLQVGSKSSSLFIFITRTAKFCWNSLSSTLCCMFNVTQLTSVLHLVLLNYSTFKNLFLRIKNLCEIYGPVIFYIIAYNDVDINNKFTGMLSKNNVFGQLNYFMCIIIIDMFFMWICKLVTKLNNFLLVF